MIVTSYSLLLCGSILTLLHGPIPHSALHPRRLSFSQRRHMRVGPVSPAHLRVCISGLSCTLTHRFSCILTHRFSCILTHRFSCILTPRLCLGSQSTGSAADSSSGFFSRSYVDGAPDNCR